MRYASRPSTSPPPIATTSATVSARPVALAGSRRPRSVLDSHGWRAASWPSISPAACAGAWPTTGVGYRLPNRNTRDPAIVATSKRIRNGIFDSQLPLVWKRPAHHEGCPRSGVGKPLHGGGGEPRRRGNTRHVAARGHCCGCGGGPTPPRAHYLGRAVARGKARILGRGLLAAHRRTTAGGGFPGRRGNRICGPPRPHPRRGPRF